MEYKYYWDFRIYRTPYSQNYGYRCPDSLDEETKEAWQRYVFHIVSGLMTEDTMRNPEFRKILEEVRVRRRKEEEYRIWREEQSVKAAEDRKRRRVMERPKITFIPSGLKVDYEEEYGRLLRQEVEFVPSNEEDFLYQRRLIERWYRKSVPQLIEMGRPDAAYGVSVALCKAIPKFIFRDDIKEMLDTQKPQLRKLIIGAFSGLVDSVRAWNNEEERQKVCDLILEESKRYTDWRGITKKLVNMIPGEHFEGEPVSVVREMNDEDRRLDRKRKMEEQKRIEAEKEARSLIPLNPDYEERIFDAAKIDWNCNRIADMMSTQVKLIRKMAETGDYRQAALRFLQLTKSMCRHFVADEHYNYFDDMYSPEYEIDELIDMFRKLAETGRLPEETKQYLTQAWTEIEDTECCRFYGLPRKNLTL